MERTTGMRDHGWPGLVIANGEMEKRFKEWNNKCNGN